MTWADWFVVAMTVQYLGAAGLYAVQGDWWRATYWLGAVTINVAFLGLGRG